MQKQSIFQKRMSQLFGTQSIMDQLLRMLKLMKMAMQIMMIQRSLRMADVHTHLSMLKSALLRMLLVNQRLLFS